MSWIFAVLCGFAGAIIGGGVDVLVISLADGILAIPSLDDYLGASAVVKVAILIIFAGFIAGGGFWGYRFGTRFD